MVMTCLHGMAKCADLIEDGRQCYSVGWPVCLVDLDDLQCLRVYELHCFVHRGCGQMRAILVDAHIPDLLLVELLFLLDLPSLHQALAILASDSGKAHCVTTNTCLHCLHDVH